MPQKSLGIIETKCLAAAIEAGDVIAKTATVDFICKELSGENYISILIKGDLGAITASLEAASSLIQQNGELIAYYIIPCPHPEIENLIFNKLEQIPRINNSIGLLEVKGLTGAIAAADAMLKNAEIKIISWEHLPGFPVILEIQGDIEHVKAALETATETSKKVKQFIKTRILSEPSENIGFLINNPGDNSIVAYENVFKEDIPATEVVVLNNFDEDSKSSEVPEHNENSGTNENPVVSDVTEIEEKKETPEKKKTKKNKVKEKPAVEKKEKFIQRESVQPERKEIIKTTAPVKKIEDNGQHDLFDMSLFAEYNSIPDIIPGIDVTEDEAGKVSNDEIIETASSGENDDKRYEELEKLTVSKLRRLARDMENFPIKGREISMANKNILLSYFKEL